MILGITGGSGSGKTTLLRLVQEKGGTVLDCDAIYHVQLKTNTAMLAAIETRFPGTVKNGELDRKALGAIVFADEAALRDLNAITHKAVKEKVEHALSKNPGLAAIDAIGLFEGGLAPLCDATVAITAPVEDRVRRLMARDGVSESYARLRIGAQHSDDWFHAHCGYVLENDSTEETFRNKCIAFLNQLGII